MWFPDPVEQLEHAHPERVGDDLHRVERWVRFAGLDSAEVGLVEAAALAELNLAEAGSLP